MDPYSGTAFYDEPAIHERYRAARSAVDEPNRTLEEPFVLRFLGDVRDRHVLDLGCGDAGIGPRLLATGALSYLGVDGSHRMLSRAQATLAGTSGMVRLADLETWEPPPGARFDLVLARMALHYVADLGRLLTTIRRACRPGARLVFSVEHPVVTCSYDGDWDDGVPRVWRVRDYYREGPRNCPWLGARVRKHHRTFETYLTLLTEAGFRLTRFSEGVPPRSEFTDPEVYERRLDVPMYATFGADLAEPGAAPTQDNKEASCG
ncbi:MAG TPA: class I SAM-dependent methyltransferase [Micromonosporaceae bacterium]